MKRACAVLLLVGGCIEDVDLGRDDFSLRIECGPTTTCGEDAAGEVLCFGLAASGQLGSTLNPSHATTETCALGQCTSTPHEANVYGISGLALSRDFGCAIIADGTQCFGGTRYGQLGDGTVDDAAHPVPAYTSLFNSPDALALGEAHGCVLYRDNRVYCWGFGGHGQLGIAPEMLDDCGIASWEDAARLGVEVGATIRCAAVPRPVPAILDASAIFAGGHGTCVVRSTGETRCMGKNDLGQLGLPQGADVETPSVVPFIAPTSIALGLRHGCVLEETRVRCFGAGDLGQLGRSGCITGCAPARVGVSAPIVVDVGLDVTWILDAYGRLFAFGDAREGALGRPASDDCDGIPCARSPRRVPLARGVLTFAGGEAHACAVLSDLTTSCFGRGTEGQTGDTFHTSSPAPRDVPMLHPVPRID